MNFLALSDSEITIIVLALSIVPIILLMVYAIFIAVRRGKKVALQREFEAKHSDDVTQKQLFNRVYGGEENIINVKLDMSRISVNVIYIEKVQVEELKELGANGVLLVNDIVKCSFGDRAPYIYNLLKKEGNNE